MGIMTLVEFQFNIGARRAKENTTIPVVVIDIEFRFHTEFGAIDLRQLSGLINVMR